MKNNILKYFILLLSVLVILIVYLSTVGIETDKFNDQIKKRITLINKKIDIDLNKIKLTLDPFKLKIYAKTVGTTVYFSKKPLALESIKTQVSLSSLIKNKISSSNIEVKTKSILLNDLIKFIRTTNNKHELFILEKIVKKGHVIIDLSLNIDEKGKLKNDYIIEGLIKDASINFLDRANFKNINFNFNFQKDNYHFDKINFKAEEVDFISKKLNVKRKKNSFLIDAVVENDQSSLNSNILKLLNLSFENIIVDDTKFKTNNEFSLEINEKFKVKNVILNSDINITQLKYKNLKIINKYFPEVDDLILLDNHKLNLNYKDKNLSIKGEGQIQFNAEEVDDIKYFINKKDNDLSIDSELFLKNIVLEQQDFLKIFFPQTNKNINFNNQKLKINFKNNNLTFSGYGKFKIDKDFEDIDYLIEKEKNKISFNTNLNVKNTKFIIDNINYEKRDDSQMYLQINGEIKNNKNLNINNFIINEENNNIKIKNLSLNDSNQIIKVDEANFNYVDIENKKNIYNIKKVEGKKYLIDGTLFNANSLISNLLDADDKKENNFFENNISMDLNFDEVYLDKVYFVKDLKGKINIINNKVEEADILAFYNNSQNIKFTIKTNNQGEKITTLFSSKAKPLVDRYKFIKGFKDDREGYLDFYSLKKDGVSTSKLVIDNFKVKEIPALAKLLALASLQGIADLLTGEGIRFTDFEMNFTNQDKLMKIQELYAIGPAISILLEGYIEEDKLISLRGTLVPATTINRSIASIPLLGDLLIGKKVGDGVFGVSFKIKGPPKDLETTVNPIKTLTPRFITRTLEKIKKN
ncbi:AsmA-like C-terminal region-containing protein [Candidatus Pelagibacter sp. FZCC0015]|uniref:AsmA-like C-terminal region-containing protein n=1 Tax=Candidatus Pelagibacter sp. FZCC0015 TaxID=2268451 RepID=UPI0011A8BB5E|nr:AsmA-like C-terminal region-containing protein [Candidatus Pelagibacter sp. FZCC0015]